MNFWLQIPCVKSSKLLPYECNYCNRQFARPHEKVKHERIHTGEYYLIAASDLYLMYSLVTLKLFTGRYCNNFSFIPLFYPTNMNV